MAYRSPYRVKNSADLAAARPTLYFDVAVEEVRSDYRRALSKSNIPKGAVICRDGGIVVTSIDDVLPELKYAVLIDEGLWLAPRDYDNLDPICYLNHSCDSNIARVGGLIYIAKRDISSGEELTIDYAPLVSDYQDWTLECHCGFEKCRKIITSLDYKDPRIAMDLWPEWLPFIQKKILSQASKP